MRALAPMLVLVLWCAAGQWGSSGREPRAWLLFVGVVGAAALVPLARRQTSRACLITHVEQWGWVALAGLLVVT
jgi:hypothetical protein